MINPQELRIGNKIYYNGEIHTIQTVGKWCHTDISAEEIPTDKFKGIDLKIEEIRNYGFETKDDQNFIIGLPCGDGTDLCLEFFTNESVDVCLIRNHTIDSNIVGDMDWCYVRSINYLHQLQNIFFNLSGQELTIKE